MRQSNSKNLKRVLRRVKIHDIVSLRQARLTYLYNYLYLHTIFNYYIKIDNVVIKVIKLNKRNLTLQKLLKSKFCA